MAAEIDLWNRTISKAWRLAAAANIAPASLTKGLYSAPLPPRQQISIRKRFLVFKRDGYTCRICRRAGGLLEVDHVKPRALGGSNKMDNLQTLCRKCNRGKRDNLQRRELFRTINQIPVCHFWHVAARRTSSEALPGV